jgi:hypothetical protein
VLTHPQSADRQPRQTHSLRQEYEEFILQRIEEFKEQLSRAELLAIADEAVRELEMGADDQLVLTEVLILEQVDRLIMRRLRLPTYRRWRQRHLRLRKAQRELTYWGLEASIPLEELVARLEEHDVTLVIGAALAPAAFYVAAQDLSVLLIDPSLHAVEAAEARAATEAIASRFEALVVSFEHWFPEVAPSLVLLDPALLARLDSNTRGALIETVRSRTVAGGAHLVWSSQPREGVTPLVPEALQAYYDGWSIERPRRARKARWFLAIKP